MQLTAFQLIPVQINTRPSYNNANLFADALADRIG